MSTSTRVSYGVLAFTIILAGFLHLGGPLLAAFFSFLALRKLRLLTKRKWLASILFGLVVTGLAFGAVYFTRAAVHALPEVAEHSIPSASAWAQARQIELPFTDVDTLRDFLINSVKEQARYLQNVAHFAGRTTTYLLFTIIAIVAASSLFLKSGFNPYEETHAVKNNLYSVYSDEVSARFGDFYHSFSTVMGAQIIISSINTVLTGVFVLAVQLPYAPLALAITFLCGLVAIGALVFLVLIHKLEYFLNSKIIGSRIRNPVWLTLIALIIGERLMGIPGLILAPVVLNYLRVEMLKIEVPPAPERSIVEPLNR